MMPHNIAMNATKRIKEWRSRCQGVELGILEPRDAEDLLEKAMATRLGFVGAKVRGERVI